MLMTVVVDRNVGVYYGPSDKSIYVLHVQLSNTYN